MDTGVSVKIQQTKRNVVSAKVTPQGNERYARELLSGKLSGSHMGLWLLVPEYLRLGAWGLLGGLFRDRDNGDMSARLGMQMVNESALCVNRVRKKDSLCHQGFSLVNGLSFLATDESVHHALDGNPVSAYENLQRALLSARMLDGHYSGENSVLAIDPHRIVSASKRVMPKKKKRPEYPSQKMMQTFFCNDVDTGQPLGFTVGASGKTCSQATLQLLDMVRGAGMESGLVLADKEHFTQDIAHYLHRHPGLEVLMPAPGNKNILGRIRQLDYKSLWPGYSMAETTFSFQGSGLRYRLLAQKETGHPKGEVYKAFITTSGMDAKELLSRRYPERWSIEEFFNFEGDMGWNRASTFNLNIRYGKQSLALIAQAAAFRLRKNLPGPYRKWTAGMLSEKVLTNMEGDLRVRDDRIIVTYYRDHEDLNLRDRYSNISSILENENVSPKIPWLFDYRLEFRFK